MVNNSVSLTGCKVNNTPSTWLETKSYWFSGDGLDEFHYGNTGRDSLQSIFFPSPKICIRSTENREAFSQSSSPTA